MNDLLPADVTITELRDGVRYRFPGRRWGPIALFGLGALIGGLLGTGFMSLWLGFVGYQFLVDGGVQGGSPLLPFLVMGGWMFLMTLRLTLQGVSRLIGHSEIELRGDTLHGIECWGWLRWGERRRIVGLSRFEVRDATLEDRPGRVYEVSRAATEYNAIVAVWDADAEEKPLRLARGYPREWLVPLARDLARRCRLAAETDSTIGSRPAGSAIEVAEEPLPNPAGFVDLPDQPDDSKVVVEATADELKLTLPRKTFGWHQAVVTVFGDGLRVERDRHRAGTGEWSRHQLIEIRVARQIDSEGPDTFEVHIEPHPGEGKRVRLTLGGEAEARWLATTLRRALRMADAVNGEAAPFLERREKPAGCRMIEEPIANGVDLLVPPTGYRHPEVRRYLLCAAGSLAAALLGGGFLYVFLSGGQVGAGDLEFLQSLWILPAVLALGAVGALAEAVRRARRHATLTVIGDTLLVRQASLFGTQERELQRSRITDVRVGDTLQGRAVGPRTRRAVLDRSDPTWELHIHLLGGEIVRLLDGYGDAELQWLATVLRRALRVPVADTGPSS